MPVGQLSVLFGKIFIQVSVQFLIRIQFLIIVCVSVVVFFKLSCMNYIFLYYILRILPLYHSISQPFGHLGLMTGLMEGNFSTDGGAGDGSGCNVDDGGNGSGGNVSDGE